MRHTIEAILASGEFGSLTKATTIAPESRAARAAASKSGLRPDCDIARQSMLRSESGALKTENIEGESEDVKNAKPGLYQIAGIGRGMIGTASPDRHHCGGRMRCAAGRRALQA